MSVFALMWRTWGDSDVLGFKVGINWNVNKLCIQPTDTQLLVTV